MSKRALITIATRHQVLLERLKARQAQDFTSVLPKLEKAIVDVVNATRLSRMSELKRRELDTLLTELRAQQEVYIQRNNEAFLARMREFAGYESGFEARTLETGLAGALKRLSLVVPTSEQAYRAALQSPLSATGQLLRPFVESWGQRHLQGVDGAVRRAWGEGRTVQQLVQEIRGTRALNYRDGLVDVSRRQAEAVARTSVQHVASAARNVTWERNSDVVQGYVWVSTLDARTTTACRSLDGKTFKLGQGPKPPLHINCRSTTIADVGRQYDFLDEGAMRVAKGGTVPADMSYYDWLKTQPASFQDVALGPSRGKLFRDGGLSADRFAALNLNRNFEPLTLDEMRALEPEAFKRAGLLGGKGGP